MSAGTESNTKLYRIRSMFLKELRLIRNDTFALLLVFFLPGMIMGTMYVAINQGQLAQFASSEQGEKADDATLLGVVDNDPTDTYPGEDLSENFTWYLSQSADFIVREFDTEEEALRALYQDTIDAYAVFQYGFEGNITGDIPAFVDIHISSTDFDTQSAVFSAFSEVVTQFRYDHGWIKGEIKQETIREFEPAGDYFAATFGVFMLVYAVFIATSATAAQAIVGDVPLNRMLLTPVTKMESILSKTLAYFVVGMIQSFFLVVLWMVLFEIYLSFGVIIAIFAVLALMSVSGSALGVMISTLVTTRLQANQSFLFILFGALILGSGFMDVGIIDEVFPLNLGRIIIVDVAFKQILLTEFLREISLILLISLAFILFAWSIFAKKTTLA